MGQTDQAEVKWTARGRDNEAGQGEWAKEIRRYDWEGEGGDWRENRDEKRLRCERVYEEINRNSCE